VKAVQELDVKMKRVETFADSYNASLLDHLKTWLADAGNGITLIAANVFKSQKVETEQLCVGSTCVTEAQLQQLLNQNQIAPQPAPEPQESPSDENIDSQGDPQGAPQDVPAQEEVVPQPEPTPEPVSEAPAQDPIPQE
jgi:outer membrane biosynthesis protein TonB